MSSVATTARRALHGRPWGAALLAAGIAAVLGVYRIGDKSLWLDEAFSISIVQLPTLDLVSLLWRAEQQGAPYHLLLHTWSALGDGEAVIRLLSVAIGVLAVFATYAVGRRFGVGLPAALILAVAPFFVVYLQEARAYSLFVAWSAITTLGYLRLTERRTRWRAATYIVAAGAMVYVHPLGAFVILAHGLATVFFSDRQSRVRLLAVYVPVVVLWLPMLRFVLLNPGRIDWVRPTTAEAVVHHLTTLTGGAALGAVLLLLMAFGLRRDVMTLWLIVPLAGILLLSLVKPVWVERYLVAALPAIAVVAARGLATRRFPVAILAGVLALSLLGVNEWYTKGHKDDWRAAAAWVSAMARPDDGVVFTPAFIRLPFAYYGHAGMPVYPSLPWTQLYVPFLGLPIEPPSEISNERIWLIYQVTPALTSELQHLLAGYEFGEITEFTGEPRVQLLERAPPSAD